MVPQCRREGSPWSGGKNVLYSSYPSVRRLRLPPQISLRPPPYFEGQQYQVTLSFGQRQELQQYAQRLLDAAQHEALDTLLELL